MINICIVARWESDLKDIIGNLKNCETVLWEDYGMKMNLIGICDDHFSSEEILPIITENDIQYYCFS